MKSVLALVLACGVAGAAGAQDHTMATRVEKDGHGRVVASGVGILAEDDLTFAKNAASAGLLEVELGNLVASRTTNEEVRRYAQSMIADHSKGNEELTGWLGHRGVWLAPELDAEHRSIMANFRRMTPDNLDDEYRVQMIVDHRKALTLFRAHHEKGFDHELKHLAAKTVPMLEHHLRLAENMLATPATEDR